MTTKERYTISGGLYLVVDPSLPLAQLLAKTEDAIKGGVDIIQIWDHWKNDDDAMKIAESIIQLAHRYAVPVIINNHIALLNHTDADGIHFDKIPADFSAIKSRLKPGSITGITCGNDFAVIQWAINNQLDYISFCSVFPSASVDTCDIVTKEMIVKARNATNMPIFLSGGITVNNIAALSYSKLNGIAVVSGIMKAENATTAALQYKTALQTINTQA